jgi:hypothetical protein
VAGQLLVPELEPVLELDSVPVLVPVLESVPVLDSELAPEPDSVLGLVPFLVWHSCQESC